MGSLGTAILDLVGPSRGHATGELRSGELTALNNPARWLLDIFSGGETDAGVTVNAATAEGITTVWRCINNIAEDTAKLPIELIRRTSDGRREVIHDHPALPLLNDMANPYASAMAVRETLMRHAVGRGNGYAEIVRNNAGAPVELWNLPPDCVEPFWVRVGDRWELEYRYSSPLTGRKQTLKPRDIIHIRGPGDGTVGFSPIKLFRMSLGLTIAAESTGAKFFGRGMRPSGVISHPKVLSPEAARNLRESIEKKYGGQENAFRMMLLEEGMTFEASTISPDDAQFLETRGFQVDEVCRIYRMPPHKVQNLARSTNNNIEHQGIEYVTDTLGAWFKRSEGEYSAKLLTTGDAGTGFEHDDHDLTRGDQKSRAETAQIYVNAGIWCADDVLARESMNPQPDGTGKQFLVPSTMMTRAALQKRDDRPPTQPLPNAPAPAPGDPAADPKKDPPQDPPEDPAAKRAQVRQLVAAMAPMVENLLERNIKIEVDRAARGCKNKAPGDWAAEFYPGHEALLRGELMFLAETMVHAVKITASGEPTVSVNELAKRAAALVCENARAAITATGNLEAALEGWRTSRAAADTRSIIALWSESLAPATLPT